MVLPEGLQIMKPPVTTISARPYFTVNRVIDDGRVFSCLEYRIVSYSTFSSVFGSQFVMIAVRSYLVCYRTGYWCCFFVPLVLYWYGNTCWPMLLLRYAF